MADPNSLTLHIEAANRQIEEFLDQTPLVFKEAEVWNTEIERNLVIKNDLEASAVTTPHSRWWVRHD